jgi:hypothetical protein
MFANKINHFMVSNKPSEHGFQDLIIIYNNNDTKEDLLAIIFTLKLKIRI